MIDYKLIETDSPKDGFSSLWDIVGFLRDPVNGCPWDKEQMPADIIRSMQGEIYEYIDALADKDKEHQKEELGDIFMNLFLLGKIQDQNKDFKISDCLNETNEKYIRRHPHVFSNVKAETSDDVLKNWANIKKNVEGRKDDEEDFFSNIERNAPELERCYKISKKAAKAGFEWPDVNGVYDKVQEELVEVKNAKDKEELTVELGDVLFSIVNLCRFYHVKPTDALDASNRKFTKRFNLVCKLAKDKGLELEKLTADQWDELWNQAKKSFK